MPHDKEKGEHLTSSEARAWPPTEITGWAKRTNFGILFPPLCGCKHHVS